MATQKQIFMKGLGAAGVFNSDQKRTSPLVANSTPQAILPAAKPVAKKAVESVAHVAPKNNYTGELRQHSDARSALARVKANQQTYGVPGAK